MITKPEFLNRFENYLSRKDYIDCLLPHLVITNAYIQHIKPSMQAPEVTPMTFIVLPDSPGEIETGMYGTVLLPNKCSGISLGNLTFGFNIFREQETQEWAEHLKEHGLIDYIIPENNTPEEYINNYKIVGLKSRAKKFEVLSNNRNREIAYYLPLHKISSSLARNHLSFSDERLTDLNRYK